MTSPTDEGLQNLTQAGSIILLYGAGVSVSAGFEPFRKQGARTQVDMSKWDWALALGSGEIAAANWLKWAANQHKEAMERVPTKFHRWLNLEKSNRIKEIFSMNVDGLETQAGLIPGIHYYPLHGSFIEMICRLSKHRREVTENDERFMHAGRFPPCVDCEIANSRYSNSRSGLREKQNMGSRPNVLLYGDQDRQDMTDIYTAVTDVERKYKGRNKVDLFLVVGTSIPPQVYHLKTTIPHLKALAKCSIYVDPAPKRIHGFDYVLEMTADDLVEALGYSDLVESNQLPA
ncbi:hypothetical protein TWF106_010720 [Orbilia oligospora]|uniref:Deacetylase sirtuin-type domain-containing protein n=1 Tax=Orbilia oligospora TaxID=2813651 RepID=A0A7C8QF22_ORBOL|nr:hypothetical protein TWF106_010720 [Orbilia oligospora]